MKKSIILSIITGLGNYLLTILIVNEYGLVARGLIEIVNSILTIAISILSFNYYNSITKSVAINGEMPKKWNHVDTWIQVVQITFAVLMMTVFNKNNLFDDFDGVYWNALAVAMVVIGSQTNINIAVLNGLKKIEETKYINFSGIIICAIFLLPAIKYLKREDLIALYFVLTYGGQYLVSEIIRRYKKLEIKEMGEIKIKYLKNGSILYVISILQIIGSRTHIFAGAKISGLEAVGAFGVLFGVAQFILMPAAIMTTYFIADNNKTSRYEYNKKIRKIVGVTIILCIASILFLHLVKYINIKIGGLEHVGMAGKLFELSPGIICFAISSMMLGIMSSEKISKLKIILYTQLASIILLPIGVFFLVEISNPMEKSYTLVQAIILVATYFQKKRNDNSCSPILESK